MLRHVHARSTSSAAAWPGAFSDPHVSCVGQQQVLEDAIRILRELRLLRLLEHPKIVAVQDVIMPSDKGTFEDVHIVFELFDTDLRQMIRSETKCGRVCPDGLKPTGPRLRCLCACCSHARLRCCCAGMTSRTGGGSSTRSCTG